MFGLILKNMKMLLLPSVVVNKQLLKKDVIHNAPETKKKSESPKMIQTF